MNNDQILFAFWCSRFRKSLPRVPFLEALKQLQQGHTLRSNHFVERWSEEYPWLRQNLLLNLDIDLQVLARWQQQGIDLVTPLDSRFPRRMLWMDQFPLLLFGQGHWDCLNQPCLSIVGSREPSDLSLSWIDSEISKLLQNDSYTIVSGGARGVDFAAHRAALRKRKPTVVIFPSGLLQMYPSFWQSSQHQWTQLVIESGGLLLSEYPPPIEMQKVHFLERNRLISGASIATLLVEARVRSGTLVTARAALEQNRPLFVLPSHPFDANSRGGLDLIADGALIVRDAQDLKLYLGSEWDSASKSFPTNWSHGEITH